MITILENFVLKSKKKSLVESNFMKICLFVLTELLFFFSISSAFLVSKQKECLFLPHVSPFTLLHFSQQTPKKLPINLPHFLSQQLIVSTFTRPVSWLMKAYFYDVIWFEGLRSLRHFVCNCELYIYVAACGWSMNVCRI